MAGAKEIRTKIGSIKNTQKITRAMEMVAASKMRKAQQRMSATRPYAEKMKIVMAHIAHAAPEYRHRFMTDDDSKEVKRVGYIIISSDRGLCGGLNGNLFRRLLRDLREHKRESADLEFCTIGSKALGFFRRFGGSVMAQVTQIGDKPRIEQLIGTTKTMIEAFEKGKIDRVYIVYNRFVNTMTQDPVIEQLLPIHAPEKMQKLSHHWDYIYEPDAHEVLDHLMMRHLESQVYQAVVENMACEQSARMVAMKSASDNAGDIIDELELIYNKARQSAITQEISEIVGGAAAVNG